MKKLPSAVKMVYDPLRNKFPKGVYYRCKSCDGWGNISPKGSETAPIPGKDYKIKKCTACKGKGYTTWLENVFGVEK